MSECIASAPKQLKASMWAARTRLFLYRSAVGNANHEPTTTTILYIYRERERVKNCSNIFTLSDYRNYSIIERFDTMPFQNYFASKRETIRSQITSQQECHMHKFLSPIVEMHNAFVH